ncbi:hypothetical protein KAR91_37430 [Candidatus Pacearchaeota archaeon]|nr:hypothetical protein [Candidatus Pacearchaeota archaeon]
MSAYWVDIIEDVVSEVRADTDKPATLTSEQPYYMHGHPLEVINTLSLKDKNDTYKFKKYPLIALFQDFTEVMGEDQKIQSSTSLNIVICMETSQDYSSAQRYDNSFRTILYPLYDLLIEKIIASGYFLNASESLTSHNKIDRLFWGKTGLYGNEGNIFNDHIDAIEIENLDLDLRVTQKTC